MTDDYEFRVTGLIGPLTRAAMPELESHGCDHETTLIGTARNHQQIVALLERLDDADLIMNDITITRTAQRAEG